MTMVLLYRDTVEERSGNNDVQNSDIETAFYDGSWVAMVCNIFTCS